MTQVLIGLALIFMGGVAVGWLIGSRPPRRRRGKVHHLTREQTARLTVQGRYDAPDRPYGAPW